jgi:putative Ig domain-containing protein
VAADTWSVASGQLPPGLAPYSAGAAADNNHRLAGTPTGAGSITFTVMVTDGTGRSTSQQFSPTIKKGGK